MIRRETWNGNTITFEQDDDNVWLADIWDVCNALELDVNDMIEHLDWTHSFMPKDSVPDEYYKGCMIPEEDIYQCIMCSSISDAKRFGHWTGSVLKRLRIQEGLEGYEIFRMCDPDIQEHILSWLDSIFYDESTDKLYISKTTAGGDVDQIELNPKTLEEIA